MSIRSGKICKIFWDGGLWTCYAVQVGLKFVAPLACLHSAGFVCATSPSYRLSLTWKHVESCVVAHAYDPSIHETEARGLPWVGKLRPEDCSELELAWTT